MNFNLEIKPNSNKEYVSTINPDKMQAQNQNVSEPAQPRWEISLRARASSL